MRPRKPDAVMVTTPVVLLRMKATPPPEGWLRLPYSPTPPLCKRRAQAWMNGRSAARPVTETAQVTEMRRKEKQAAGVGLRRRGGKREAAGVRKNQEIWAKTPWPLRIRGDGRRGRPNPLPPSAFVGEEHD